MGGFLNSIFGGQSKELNSLVGTFGQSGNKQLNQGQNNENTASGFWSAILSGDSTKQMQALSPEVSAAKTSAAQSNKTAAEFGTRSGGTAASTAATSDKVHSDITNLIGSLTNSSASSLASLGSNEVSAGSGLLGQEQGAVAQRMQNWSDSIFGKTLTSAAAAGTSFLLGSATGFNNKSTPGTSPSASGPIGSDAGAGYASTVGLAPNGYFDASGNYVGGASPA